MKKRLFIIIPIIIISECIIATTLFAFLILSSGPSKDISADASAGNALSGNASYDVKAEVETNVDRISVKSVITFDEPAKVRYIHMPSFNAATTEIRQITDGEQSLAYVKKGTVLEVTSERQFKEVILQYDLLTDSDSGLLSHIDGTYYLTNFLAVPAVIKDGKPLKTYESEFGDPYVYQSTDYYVVFKTDKDKKVFAPGSSKEQVLGLSRITEFSTRNLRDFSAVISSGLEVETVETSGIRVHYIGSTAARKHVEYALKYASSNIGPYPYKDLFVIKAPISLNGMEFSTMIFLSDRCFTNKEDLKRVAYHEVLHQWFYGIIGTDQVNEPFLDEGLVQYLTMQLANGKLGQAYKSSLLDMGLADFTSREEYNKLIYDQAAVYMGSIHRKLGNNFNRMLQKIYADKKFGILYFDSFEKYIEEFRGK